MDAVKEFMEREAVFFEDLPAGMEAGEPESMVIHEWNGGESDETQ